MHAILIPVAIETKKGSDDEEGVAFSNDEDREEWEEEQKVGVASWH